MLFPHSATVALKQTPIPTPSPVPSSFSVRYNPINPAYLRRTKNIRRKHAAVAAVHLLLFWAILILFLRPEPFGQALLVGLEKSGPFAGGALICLLLLYLRAEEFPATWKREELLLEFNDNGLSFCSPIRQGHYLCWTAFRSWEENLHGFTLYEYGSLFIPSHPFEPEALEAFRACLRAGIPSENRKTDALR